MGLVKSIKLWQLSVLLAVLLLGTGASIGIYTLFTGSDETELEADQQRVAVQLGNLVNEVSVNGSIVYPDREALRFSSPGTLAELLVVEGQEVLENDPLASLDLETVANLERSVAQARVTLRDAEEALADFSSDPSELVLANAEAKLANAEIALSDASEALDLVRNPTELLVAQAKAKVASANVALVNAQDAMDSLTAPPMAQAVGAAEAKVASAELNVQNVSDLLETLQEPASALEIAQAEAKLTEAKLVEAKAVESMEAIEAGASAEDFSDAGEKIASAQTALAIAEAELAFVIGDWESKLASASTELQGGIDDYLNELENWLGAKLDAGLLDGDVDVVLDALGADLTVLFDPALRFGDLVDGGYFSEGLPADDPETKWNEITLFMWLNFSPAEIVATCDQDSAPLQGLCVRQELDTVAAAYQQAVDNLASQTVQSAKAVEAAENAVAKSEDALTASQDALADLNEPVDALSIEEAERQLTLASASVKNSEDALVELLMSTSQVALDDQKAQLELARANLLQAVEDLAELIAPEDDAVLANQQTQVDLARASLGQADQDLAQLLADPDPAELEAKRLGVEVARLNLQDLIIELADLKLDPDPLDLSVVQANVATARAALEQAETELASAVIHAPWSGIISTIAAEVGDAVNLSTPIIEIVDPTVVEIDGIVDEIDVLFVRVGSRSVVSMDALPGQVMEGTVSSIESTARNQQGVVSYPLRIRVTPPDGIDLPEGLSAVASVVIREDVGVLLVPIQSLYGSFEEPTVKVIVDGRIVDRPVVLGNNDDFWAVVSDGVAEGDVVIMQSTETQTEGFRFSGGFRQFGGGGFSGAGGGRNFTR